MSHQRIQVSMADERDRREIYRIRHDVYAAEIRQHVENADRMLTDALDAFNQYIVLRHDGEIAGFISITPPGSPKFSVDKYFARSDMPFEWNERLFEIRLLTVRQENRRLALAMLLMYAAFRWVESAGGTRIVAIGRREVLSLYVKSGLERLGRTVKSGEVTFELLSATTEQLGRRRSSLAPLFMRIHRQVDWKLDIPYFPPATCFHGGAFFEAVGEEFETLDRSREIINADVLDAWFPPSPRVVGPLREYLSWVARTSPPTGGEGLIRTISRVRNIPPECIVPGGGSSDLIYRALRHWLSSESRVLMLDPTYGEYPHVAEKIIGCRVDRLNLSRENGYAVPLDELSARRDFDLVVLVNPNSPTGRHIRRDDLIRAIRSIPKTTRIWIDETYIEYVGSSESLETFAASSANVVVCKSMSKVYALSGLRAAYLCAPPHLAREIRSITPPWVVSLPAQIGAVMALQDPEYYSGRYAETQRLRSELAGRLRKLDLFVQEGVANFLLCHLPPGGPDSACVCEKARSRGLYLRDLTGLSPRLGTHALRIAVKDADTNARMVDILRSAL